jgi:glycosyltransferase involved in cell wall biosynthesis
MNAPRPEAPPHDDEGVESGPVRVSPARERLLVVIPARNEAERIGGVIAKLRATLPGAHVLVVEDGSSDDTVGVARRSGATVLPLAVGIGYGGALQTGFKYAIRNGFSRVVTLDADGQHDPLDVPKVLARLGQGDTDLVIGSRFCSETGYRTGAVRRATMAFFAWLTSLLAGQRISDTTSGFQAIGEKALRMFADEYPHDYPNAEVLVDLARHGGKIAEVPIVVHARTGGTSMFDVWSAAYYVVKMNLSILMVLVRKRRPIPTLPERTENGGAEP